jgi:murein peptide amidase A
MRRWEARNSEIVRLRQIATRRAGSLPCVDIGDPGRPSIALAAGIHGDEPGGPWALLELVERDALDPRFCYRIWPCINVSGYGRTRESADGVDINRTFGGAGASPEASAVLAENRARTFVLSLDLHEDSDAEGFYCYEYGGGQIGRRVIAALEADGLPIDPLEATFDLAGPLGDAHCLRERGRVVADPRREGALLGGLSYSLALAHDAARYALTFETPSTAAWGTRIAMHCTAVLAAIVAL